jgi:hypothetical protein
MHHMCHEHTRVVAVLAVLLLTVALGVLPLRALMPVVCLALAFRGGRCLSFVRPLGVGSALLRALVLGLPCRARIAVSPVVICNKPRN